VLAEPFLDLFLLRGQHDTLPFHFAGPLTVLSHYVRAFIEDQNEAVRLGPLEVVGRGRRMVFLHLPHMIAGARGLGSLGLGRVQRGAVLPYFFGFGDSLVPQVAAGGVLAARSLKVRLASGRGAHGES